MFLYRIAKINDYEKQFIDDFLVSRCSDESYIERKSLHRTFGIPTLACPTDEEISHLNFLFNLHYPDILLSYNLTRNNGVLGLMKKNKVL